MARLEGTRLEGRVAVVTGGGNGIGRACAQRFAEEGADVPVADVQDEPGKETVELVRGLGRRAEFVHVDAAEAADNEAMAQLAVEELGGIDVLVTAAGISHSEYVSGDITRSMELIAESVATEPAHLFANMPIDRWQRVLDVNLTGTLLAMQAAVRVMLQQARGGSIVTIASIAAKVPEAGPVSYAVSKAGVWMLTKHAARSLGAAGIRVNAIGPGFIDTNMTKIIREIPGVADQVLTQVPLGRMGTARDVADAALFLASDESSYFTGEILHPDGGFYTD